MIAKLIEVRKMLDSLKLVSLCLELPIEPLYVSLAFLPHSLDLLNRCVLHGDEIVH